MAIQTVTIHPIGMGQEAVSLSWHSGETEDDNYGDGVRFISADGIVVILGMMGPNRISLEIGRVVPDDAV